MKEGDLVKWTFSWIVSKRFDCDDFPYTHDYGSMVGILTTEWHSGWHVLWNDGETRTVHRDYLEAL